MPQDGCTPEQLPIVEDPAPGALTPGTGLRREDLSRMRAMLLRQLTEEQPRLAAALQAQRVAELRALLHGWVGAATYCEVPRLLARLELLRRACAARPEPSWTSLQRLATALETDLALLRAAAERSRSPRS